MKKLISDFKQIWLWDFEFHGNPGDVPIPLCMVAKEIHSGKILRLWQSDFKIGVAPFDMGHESLFIAFYASAELSCHLALEWNPPVWICDFSAEFRNTTNGLFSKKKSMLDALAYYGIASISDLEKEKMRDLILTGGPFNESEKQAILKYCETDVVALENLFPKLVPNIDLSYAALRGHYIKSVAKMERVGTPLDVHTLCSIRSNWSKIVKALIDQCNSTFDVYEDGSFKRQRFEVYLKKKNIQWPRYPSGELILTDETFKDMAQSHSEVAPLKELRKIISNVKLSELQVGADGRNRALLSPFGAITSRNTPSTNKFIFGLPKALRHLIKPSEGMALAYIDYSQQEIGIAAALSNDEVLKNSYLESDVYLSFGKLSGALPIHATKTTHPAERKNLKAVVLGTGYGQGPKSLADKMGTSIYEAKHLLSLHRQSYKKFWRWQASMKDAAFVSGKIETLFGWKYEVSNAEPTSVGNFPMQANGAEMLRIALCFLHDAGIRVCAPIHDAVLIEAPIEHISNQVEIAKECMIEASRIVLDGFPLRVDAEVFCYPERFKPEEGLELWEFILTQLHNFKNGRCSPLVPDLRDIGTPVQSIIYSIGSN